MKTHYLFLQYLLDGLKNRKLIKELREIYGKDTVKVIGRIVQKDWVEATGEHYR